MKALKKQAWEPIRYYSLNHLDLDPADSRITGLYRNHYRLSLLLLLTKPLPSPAQTNSSLCLQGLVIAKFLSWKIHYSLLCFCSLVTSVSVPVDWESVKSSKMRSVELDFDWLSPSHPEQTKAGIASPLADWSTKKWLKSAKWRKVKTVLLAFETPCSWVYKIHNETQCVKITSSYNINREITKTSVCFVEIARSLSQDSEKNFTICMAGFCLRNI